MKIDFDLGHSRLIVSTCMRYGLLRNQAGYVLATAYWETARTMEPVREAFWLSEGWRKENLRYYPWYGRGFVQLTWERNYHKAGLELGVDLTTDADKVMEPEIAVEILVIGSRDGWFTGKKLSDYITESLDDEADRQALRLVCLLHDFGEIAGELTVVNDDLNGKRVLSSRDKVKIEADVFYIMMNLALDAVKTDNSELFESTLAMLRPIVEEGVSKDSFDKRKRLIKEDDDFKYLNNIYTEKSLNKMISVFFKALDRAEGTIYFCENSEDVDLMDPGFIQKAIEYNMRSLYNTLPEHLGGREDYINTFRKVKCLLKAAVRRFKHLGRFSNKGLLESINDYLGRYYTWGKDEYVYYVKSWTLLDLFKLLTGEFKVHNKLSEVYNA